MVKKEKTTKKVKEVKEIKDDESEYVLSDDEDSKYFEKRISQSTTYQIPEYREFNDNDSIYLEDFNKALQKIKALKELHQEEINCEKPTQQIVDALTEKISELIKKLD